MKIAAVNPLYHAIFLWFFAIATARAGLALPDNLFLDTRYNDVQHNAPWRFYENTPQPIIKRPPARIAIIIDDLGYQRHLSQMSAALPGKITLAVLPHSPYSAEVVNWASEHGKELILHIPMQPESAAAWKQGLSLDMDEIQLRSQLKAMLDSVPGIRGVNNHMGSALTQNRQMMTWVMEELIKRQLYFVDSRTTAKTQAQATAMIMRLPNARRDVFLDNDRDPSAIAAQFEKLLVRAEAQGAAIAIGHPYPETILFLQAALPTLNARGVELVHASQLVHLTP